MSYIPNAISPTYSLLKERIDFSRIQDLKYPQNQGSIGALSLVEKQVWLASLEPQVYMDFALREDFKKYWYRVYLRPLKIKRFLYKLKFW